MEQLVQLPASRADRENVSWHPSSSGVVVDTQSPGWPSVVLTTATDRAKIEQGLVRVVPRDRWRSLRPTS